MKVSRHPIKLGKFVSSLRVHASYCADYVSELEQAAAVAWGSLAPALSPVRASMKSLAWPMSPTEPVPGYHARAVHDRAWHDADDYQCVLKALGGQVQEHARRRRRGQSQRFLHRDRPGAFVELTGYARRLRSCAGLSGNRRV